VDPIVTLEERCPALRELLGYFHQDYRLYGDTIEAVVATFIEDNVSDPLSVRDAFTQVEDLIGSPLTDDDLTELTIHSGVAEFWPPGIGLTTRGWLERIRDRLALHLRDTDTTQ
jgi:hypothetical protein